MIEKRQVVLQKPKFRGPDLIREVSKGFLRLGLERVIKRQEQENRIRTEKSRWQSPVVRTHQAQKELKESWCGWNPQSKRESGMRKGLRETGATPCRLYPESSGKVVKGCARERTGPVSGCSCREMPRFRR